MVTLAEGEWSCYGGGQFKGGRGYVRGGQFNGGRMVTEVVSLSYGEWSGGQFNVGRKVMLLRWPV